MAGNKIPPRAKESCKINCLPLFKIFFKKLISSFLQIAGNTVSIVDSVEDWPVEVVEEESNEYAQLY